MINHEDNNDWLIKSKINLDLNEKIKKNINDTIKKQEPENLKKLSTRGCLSKQYTLLHTIDKNLLNQIKELVIKDYKKLFDVKKVELEMVGAWTVFGDKGGWHKIHDHTTYAKNPSAGTGGVKRQNYDYIGVIIYLETPEPTFDEPGQFYYLYDHKPDDYLKYQEIDVTTGTVIIMPSWLLHGAYPCSGKRQSLNFEFDITES